MFALVARVWPGRMVWPYFSFLGTAALLSVVVLAMRGRGQKGFLMGRRLGRGALYLGLLGLVISWAL